MAKVLDKLSQYNPYDIIIFDYDLGEKQKKGNEIARDLRRSIFTDMIFYSGNAPEDLREALFESQVEGVFTVSRPDFVDEAWPIIEDQIKRICDINNMRGVILDEMSKVDLKIRELYKKKYDTLIDEEKENQVNSIKRKLKKRQKDLEKQKAKVNKDTILDIIKNPIQTEFNIVRTRLKDMYNGDDIFGEEGELKLKQDLRNQFAHNKTVYDEDNGTVSLHNIDIKYNFEDFKNIRKELISLLAQIEQFE